MRFGITLLLFVAVWLPSPSVSSPVEVRSGAHETFTRLVFYLLPNTSWSVTQTDNRVRVSLTNAANGFATSTVFDRINRVRIQGLREADDSLEITTHCRCLLSSQIVETEQGQNLLVVDFFDEPVARDQAFSSQSTPLETKEVEANDQVETKVAKAQMQLVDPLPVPTMSSDLPNQAGDIGRLPMIVESSAQIAPPSTETLLLSHLQHGVRLGLVSTQQPSLSDMSEQISTKPLPDDVPLQITVTDSSRDSAVPPSPSSPNQPNCELSSFLDPNTWGSDGPFAEGLDLIQKTTLQNGSQNSLQLAGHYLRHGLEAEASSLLSDQPWSLEKEAMELAVSVLQGAPLPEEARPSLQCGGAASVWGFLLAQDTAELRAAPVTRILQRYLSFPEGLRLQLETQMTEHLLNNGFEQEATALSRSLRRISHRVVSQRPDRQISEAIEIVKKQEDPQLLLDALEARPPKGEQSHSSEIIDSFAYEQRYEDGGIALQDAALLALLNEGDFHTAFSRMRAVEDQQQGDALATTLFQALTERADDLTFLDVISDSLAAATPPVDPSATTVISRLLSLGFGQLALELHSQSPASSQATLEKREADFAARIAKASSASPPPVTPSQDAITTYDSNANLGQLAQSHLILQRATESRAAMTDVFQQIKLGANTR